MTAARSTPAPAHPAARRPPGHRRRRARRGRARRGAWPPARCPPRPAATPTAILAAAASRRARRRWWSAGWTRTTWPTRPLRREALREVGFLVSLELHTSRGDRAGRRGAAGRAGRAGVRQLPGLGGPAPRVRPGAGRHRRAARLPGARHARRRDGRRPVHPDAGRRGRRARAARCATRHGGRGPRCPPAGRCVPATGRRCWPPGASCIDVSSLAGDEPALAGTARPAHRAVQRRDRPSGSASRRGRRRR